MTGVVTAPADDGGQVLTIDPEMPIEPVWRAGSKRPSLGGSASSPFSSGSFTEAPPVTGLSRPTVSSQVPALRVFLLLGIGFAPFVS
jgi:hypothetical protein